MPRPISLSSVNHTPTLQKQKAKDKSRAENESRRKANLAKKADNKAKHNPQSANQNTSAATANNAKDSPFTGKSNRLSSEIKGSRLLQTFMEYRDATGVTKIGRVKLDTQSNGCYSPPDISLPRKWRPWEPRTVQGIGANILPLGDPLYFTVMKNGVPIKIDTNTKRC